MRLLGYFKSIRGLSGGQNNSNSIANDLKGKAITIIKYCYNCGGELNETRIEGRVRKVCSKCGVVNYQNPIPSVAVVITDDQGRLLLTKRAVEPGIGLWCLPGGFIENNETPEATAMREVKEETGLEIIVGECLGARTKIGGYHGDVVIIGYKGSIAGGELHPGDDAQEVRYFALNELPQIAFRSHISFIETHFAVKIEQAHILH
jgi:ADP-ribose pyrophosphatase YjhB (NUDIX family)